MNFHLIAPEMIVAGGALAILLIDLWTPADWKPKLGCLALFFLALALAWTAWASVTEPPVASFSGMLRADGVALFFRRFFLVAALGVTFMSIHYLGRTTHGIAEFHALMMMALTGMMFAAAANDLVLAFVAVELISVSFYVLVSFQRTRASSLEAGVKYLILSALAAAFLVFGIALVFGTAGSTNFADLSRAGQTLALNKGVSLGLLLILIGLAFKIAAFPLQMWAPDVYQGAPTPVTAFLAIGSKAAGFVLVLRILFIGFPLIAGHWNKLLIIASAVTILYGNLCAIPQRSLKRLLGYSSISNAGYMLLGVAAVNADGSSAVLYYLAGYMATLAAAFVVICLVAPESDDISVFAGLHERSPLLAGCMALAMVSLAGIPPLAGFLGKFLLLRAVIERGFGNPAYFWLAGAALVGVVISLYYYFGVIKAMYWQGAPAEARTIEIPVTMKALLGVSVAGMLYLGVCPGGLFDLTDAAVKALRF